MFFSLKKFSYSFNYSLYANKYLNLFKVKLKPHSDVINLKLNKGCYLLVSYLYKYNILVC